jgi:hypothetical protein
MKILEAIAAQAGLARFASFTYTTKTTGETARYTLQLGFSYRNSLQRSLMELEVDSQIMTGVERLAADELIKSMKASLDGTQSKYTKKDIYQPYKDENGNTIQGIKVNTNDGSIKVFGLVHSKVQISPATIEKKSFESSDLTLAKNRLRKNLPIGKFCEFDLGHLSVAKISGETLELA